MNLQEREVDIRLAAGAKGLLARLAEAMAEQVDATETVVRFAVTESEGGRFHCELGILSGLEEMGRAEPDSIFRFQKRAGENGDAFNAVLLVPTGIGSEIGGHAGDATPVARLVGAACDRLITHPNVVNASDLNEMPHNALYVEGSVISRLMMGTVGLRPVRSNRILVVIDAHQHDLFVNAAVNSVSAARASFGAQCTRVVTLDPPIRMEAEYTGSGSAAGHVDGLDTLLNALDRYRDEYDAVALASVIKVPEQYHMAYFQSEGDMVNPWGGVEAMLTHGVSMLYNLPSAHAPMFESSEIANMDSGIVDPRMAAEAVSMTFLHCVLKGLHRSPRIAVREEEMRAPDVLTAEDVSCLVIPDGCVGLPTLAALEQGIPVIAVRENKNRMRNDLTQLPWRPGQLHIVENYWEAVGVMTALKAGVAPESVRRPLARTSVEEFRPTPSAVDRVSEDAASVSLEASDADLGRTD